MFIFDTLRYRNLLSAGDQFIEIDLSGSPQTLVVGTNGSGKSSGLLDGMCLCLFDRPYRKINKGRCVNTINKKDTVVEVEGHTPNGDKYLVRRGIKPNIFEIYKNGVKRDQSGDSGDDQTYLEKNILGMTYKTFKQVVILGTATYVPFMELEAAERRGIVEDLLDIQIFSTMNVLAKTKLKALQESFSKFEHSKELLEDKIQVQRQFLSTLENHESGKTDEIDNKINELKNKNTTLAGELEALKEKDAAITEKLVNVSKIKTLDEETKTVIRKLKVAVENLQETVDFFADNDTCPTCTQEINPAFKKTIVADTQEKQTAHAESMAVAEDKLAKIAEKLALISKAQEAQRELHGKISKLQHEMSVNLNRISELQEEAEEDDNKEQIGEVRGKIKTLNTELKALTDENEETEDTISEYETIVNLLKDSGFKTQIIKQYLPIMNKLINEYMEKMNFPAAFTIDEEFNEKILSRYRDDFNYANFSEGEKQRINLALLLTWRKIAQMRNSAATNLLILDEVFDSSLDVDGTEGFMSILKGFDADTNVFVISHNSDMHDRFDRVIRFSKAGNFSQMEIE